MLAASPCHKKPRFYFAENISCAIFVLNILLIGQVVVLLLLWGCKAD